MVKKISNRRALHFSKKTKFFLKKTKKVSRSSKTCITISRKKFKIKESQAAPKIYVKDA